MSFSTGDIPTGNDNYFSVNNFLQNIWYFENYELKIK